MCVVSFVSDHYMAKWPLPRYYPNQTIPEGTPFEYIMTKAEWDDYQALKKKAAEYDKHTKQPDCVKPENDEWEQKVIAILKKQGIL